MRFSHKKPFKNNFQDYYCLKEDIMRVHHSENCDLYSYFRYQRIKQIICFFLKFFMIKVPFFRVLIHNLILCFGIILCFVFFNQNGTFYDIKPNKRASFFGHNPFYDRSSSFFDVLEVVLTQCINESLPQGRSYEKTNIDISDCYFYRFLEFENHGGVIFVNGGTYTMKISTTTFYNSSSVLDGGAIFFYSPSSFLKMICAHRCNAPGKHFAYLWSSQENWVEYLSMSYCSYMDNGIVPLYLYAGNQILDNSNSSMNRGGQISGLGVYYPTSFRSYHCTISNNNVTGEICIYFSSNKGSMSFANIVHNYSPSSGVLKTYKETPTIEYSVFSMNNGILFCVSTGFLNVFHSFIQHNYTLSISNSITTSNSTFSEKPTYFEQYYFSQHCHADNTLPFRTPNNSPWQTISETFAESPVITNTATLFPTIAESFQETPERTLDETPFETISANYEETPERTLDETPFETISATYEETPERTLDETPFETISATYEETPERTLDETPFETISATYEETPERTLDETPFETISATYEETPERTLDETPFETISATYEETPERTHAETISSNSSSNVDYDQLIAYFINQYMAAIVITGVFLLIILFICGRAYCQSMLEESSTISLTSNDETYWLSKV